MKKRNIGMNQGAARQRGGMLLGVFIGLVLGVVIAALVVWYLNHSPNPFQHKDAKEEPPPVKPAASAAAAAGTPEPLPGKPGEKPRFEFYKILPGGQDAAPAPNAPPPAPTADAGPSGTDAFYLQVGAFQKAAEAENLKAKLALMGVEANIQEVNVADKGKMLRVRSGPYAKLEEMNRVRNQLSQSGVQATVVKIKE